MEEFLHMFVEPGLVPPRHVVYLALLKNNQVIVPLGIEKNMDHFRRSRVRVYAYVDIYEFLSRGGSFIEIELSGFARLSRLRYS